MSTFPLKISHVNMHTNALTQSHRCTNARSFPFEATENTSRSEFKATCPKTYLNIKTSHSIFYGSSSFVPGFSWLKVNKEILIFPLR